MKRIPVFQLNKQTSSLAYSTLGAAINKWLVGYPDHLLSAEQFLFLMLNQNLNFNANVFDEAAVLNGSWSNAYRSLKDNGTINLFYCLESKHLMERLSVLRKSNTFSNYEQFYEDLHSLIRCDQYQCPITFAYDDLFNLNTATDRDLYNFFTSIARAYIEYDDIIKHGYETGLIDLTGRTSLLLSFDICVDVPNIFSENSKRITDKLKMSLELDFQMYYPDLKTEANFNKFVYSNLPFISYVYLSPQDFLLLSRKNNYQPIRNKYLELQQKITSLEEVNKYENRHGKNESQTSGSTDDFLISVSEVSLKHLQGRTHSLPNFNRYQQQKTVCNRRILKDSQWLFSIQNLHPALESVLPGTVVYY